MIDKYIEIKNQEPPSCKCGDSHVAQLGKKRVLSMFECPVEGCRCKSYRAARNA